MRINERHDFLGDYIRTAANGDFGIAEFQRPFVWEKKDVEDFVWSIQKGLPVGSFLLWTPDHRGETLPPSKGRIGPIVHPEQTKTVILDGQNRLTSMIWAARAAEAPVEPKTPYSVQEQMVFLSGDVLTIDGDEKRIHFLPAKDSWGPNRMPLGDALNFELLHVVSSRDTFALLDKHGVRDENIGWMLDDVPRAFRERRIVVTELEAATPEEALEAFLVVAKAGQPISKEDHLRATQWISSFAPQPSSPAI